MFSLVRNAFRAPVLRSATPDPRKLSPRDFALEIIALEPKITDHFTSRAVAELSRQEILDIVLADLVVLTTRDKQNFLKALEDKFTIIFTDHEKSQILERRLSIQALLTHTRKATWRRDELKKAS